MSIANLFSNRFAIMSDIQKVNDRLMPTEEQKTFIESVIMTHGMELASKGFIPVPDREQISVSIDGDQIKVDNQYTADIMNFEHPDYMPLRFESKKRKENS
jgi:hypothetical protein